MDALHTLELVSTPRKTQPDVGQQQIDGAGFAQDLAGLTLSVQREHADQAGSMALVAEAAVKLIPGANGAAIVVPAPTGELRVRAAHGDLPLVVAELQNELGQGPCLEAAAQRGQILVRDTAAERDWPGFTGRAAAVGAASIMCTPLTAGPKIDGCLILVSKTPDAFDEQCARLASAFAAHAGIALAGAESRRQFGVAVATRDVIGQAKGILMERYRVTADAAFALLARVSQDTNTKLRDVASELCRTGGLPLADHARQHAVATARGSADALAS
jgi:transcriptional regulator with GAF, ATPase, and Fis domain